MTLDNDIPDGFPAYDHAKDFYARYDVKEILGRYASNHCFIHLFYNETLPASRN